MCKLAHPQDDVVLRRRDQTHSFYRCIVCGAGIETKNGSYVESLKHGPCFLGEHVTAVDDVDFRSNGGAAITCIEKKCLRVFFV